jgi:hypothetical protein
VPRLFLTVPIAVLFAVTLTAAIAGFWKMGDLAAPAVIALAQGR